MKNLVKNIWQAPSSTIAAAISATVAVLTANDAGLPKVWTVALLALAAFLSVFAGPAKPAK